MRIVAAAKSAFAYIIFLNIHVEPLIFAMSACKSARQVLMPALMQEKMERTYTPPENLTGTALEKFYNKQMVRWDQYYDYISIPLNCIISIFYGSYSDRRGRKIPMLFGMASLAVDTAFHMLVLGTETDFPLYFLLISASLTAFMGDFFLFMSAVNAYLADIFPVKKTLSKRMVIVSILFSLGALVGSLGTKHLVKVAYPMAVLAIVEGGIFLSVIFCLFVVKHVKPKSKSIARKEGSEEPRFTVLAIPKKSILSLVDSIKIFLLPREGHRRCFLSLSIIAAFLDKLVFGEEKALIGIYTRLSPFNWDTQEYATYNTIRPIVQIAGMFFGLIVLKRFCRLRDTTLIILSILSIGSCVLVVGLAQSSWLIYVSLVLGSLHGLLNPLTYTFISCLVDPDEVGKAFAISSIAGNLAGISQTAILHTIYTETVDWYQGFVWLVMAGISAVSALIFIFIHFIAKKEEIGAH